MVLHERYHFNEAAFDHTHKAQIEKATIIHVEGAGGIFGVDGGHAQGAANDGDGAADGDVYLDAVVGVGLEGDRPTVCFLHHVGELFASRRGASSD